MSLTRDAQYSTPTPSWGLGVAIIVYGVAVVLATQVVAAMLGLSLPLVPSIAVSGATVVLGLFLDLLELLVPPTAAPSAPPKTAPSPAGPPPPARSLIYSALMVVAVCVIMGVAFWYAHRTPNGPAAIGFAFAAALAWGLSVAGTLLWTSFFVIGHVRWNSWMNFFAAGFAALAAGYTTP